MGCKYIYKDAHGNPSAIYYRALEEYGPEKAEEMYVRHMIGLIDTRFSKESMQSMEKEKANILLDEDTHVYTNATTGATYDSVTTILNENITLPNSLLGMMTGRTAEDVVAEKWIKEELPVEDRNDAGFKKALEKDPELLNKVKKDVKALFDAQQKWGTEMHTILEAINIAWEAIVDEATAKNNGKFTIVDTKRSYEAVLAAKESLKEDWYHLVNGIKKEKFDEKALSTLVKQVYDRINTDSLAVKKRLHLKPEFRVASDKLRNYKTNKGVAGTIDLLVIDEDKVVSHVFDFKTKAMYRKRDFEHTSGKVIGGPFFPAMEDSAKNRSTGQQRMYCAVLNDNKYGINPISTTTVEIDINYVPTDAKAKDGEKEFYPYQIGTTVVHKAEDTGDAIEPVKLFFRKGELKNIYEQARTTGIAKTVETWSGEQADGTPNATHSKDHREAYIRNAPARKRTNPATKKMVVDGLNRKIIDVEGMSDEQIRKVVGDDYDTNKANQENIAGDVVKYFTDRDARLSTLKDKHNAISVALRGFDPSTHRLELAQGVMDELNGIGPDVIIATNRSTQTVSLISLVTTMNTKINFNGDGSGDARSSLLGKYATDKMLEPKALEEDMMSEARAHDFIAMKLGLAALYLRKRNPNLNIDQMKVVTMGYGTSVQITPTTFETELNKLNQFKKYAGTDFPSEYAALVDEVYANHYTGGVTDDLKSFISQLRLNTDPMGKQYSVETKAKIISVYDDYSTGKLVGWELRSLIGNYLQTLAYKLKGSMTDDQVKLDKRFVAASKALLELMKFNTDLGKYASERVLVESITGLVGSGDKTLIRLHVLYNDASSRIRTEMNEFSKDHNKVLDALKKDKGTTYYGDTKKLFSNLYRKGDDPTDRMMLKDENDGSLSEAERNYIKFFNAETTKAMVRIAPPRYREDILNGRFWKPGTVPTMLATPELITENNFKSWTKLKNATSAYVKSFRKSKSPANKSILELDYATQFDGQAADEAIGNSKKRRRMLGLQDEYNPKPMPENIETNLALILNLNTLEAAEKINYRILLQTAVAAESMLASMGDRKTKLTQEMIDVWREGVVFSRYKDEPIANILDPINKLSSDLLFSWSIRQGMNEMFTGTAQTASTLLSNNIQNMWARFSDHPENAGRFNNADFVWGLRAWNANGGKVNQIVYDHGMLQADADDLNTPEFKAHSKSHAFVSKSGYALNRLFFNSAILQSFLAQIKHLHIDEAYVKVDGRWVYDETLDKRFFAYDPENNIGKTAPQTDDELKRFSLWKAVRKTIEDEGLMHKDTKRMLVPMTGNERTEIKLYATRVYGSFNKDAYLHGEAVSIVRAMARYKKWAAQKIANYWTPTVRDEDLYGHWETIKNADGEYETIWVGDDFQGIIQTLGFMVKELVAHRDGTMKSLNKYQRENLSKLLADLLLVLLMTMVMIPILSGITEELDPETGEITKTSSTFAKSVSGQSVVAAANNATADLAFVLSAQSLFSNILPGVGTIATSVAKGFGAVGEIFKPEGVPGEKAWGAVKGWGPLRSGNMFKEALAGELF